MLVGLWVQPALVVDHFIQELKSHEIKGEIVHYAKAYKVGQRVEVTSGSFGGLVRTIVKMDDKDHRRVLMKLLSRQVKVQVAIGMVILWAVHNRLRFRGRRRVAIRRTFWILLVADPDNANELVDRLRHWLANISAFLDAGATVSHALRT